MFVAVFLGYSQYWPGEFTVLCVFSCPGAPEASTGSGSDFKASQKIGPRLKVSSDRLGEAGNRTCDPWFRKLLLVAVFLGYNQYWSGGFMGVCFLCPRTPEA